MDERMLETLRQRYQYLSDKELFGELDLLNKDASFLFRDEDLELYCYFEREKALNEEFARRGLVSRW